MLVIIIVIQRITRWTHIHRRKQSQEPDAFLERFSSSGPEKRENITGWKAFILQRRCLGGLVFDTTRKGHYWVRCVTRYNKKG